MIENLVFAAVFAQFIGKASYIKNTLKGKTKPNRISWFLWSLAPLIAAFAEFSDGVGLSAIPVFLAGFSSLVVFAASFLNKRSYWKLERNDYFCALFSLLALIFWAVTNEPAVAILFSLLSDLFASIPTLRKSWHYPESESADAYVGGMFSALTSFFAMTQWNFSSVAFSLYLTLLNATIILFIHRKNIFKKFPAPKPKAVKL